MADAGAIAKLYYPAESNPFGTMVVEQDEANMFHWGSKLYGEVDRARHIFSVSTQFVHMNGIPCLPEKSYMRLVVASQTVQVAVPLNWKSVWVTWGRAWAVILGIIGGFLVLASVTLSTAEQRISQPLVIPTGTICCAMATILWWLTRRPWVLNASYERAVRLALQARLDDAILECLQDAYGKMPDCAVVAGHPVSSSVILYLCADGELPQKTRTALHRRLHTFAERGKWQLPDMWAVDVLTDVEDELGLIAALPSSLPPGWDEDVQRAALYCAQLREKWHVDFILGVYDVRRDATRDLLRIDSPQPNMVMLRTAIGQLAATAKAPRAPRPADGYAYQRIMPSPLIISV